MSRGLALLTLCLVAATATPLEAAEPPQVRQLLRRARECAGRIEKECPRNDALELVAVAQAGAGGVEEAVTTAGAISSGYERALALVEVAEARTKSGDAAGAESILAKAFEPLDAIDKGRPFLRTNAVAHIAVGYAKARNTEKALQLLARIGGSDRNFVLEGIAEALAAAGDVKAALEAVSPIRERERAWSLRSLSLALAGSSRTKESLRIAAAIQDAHLKAVALCEIAEVQAKAGDARGAAETAHAIEDGTRRALALAHVARAQARTGERTPARRTLGAALEEVGGAPEEPFKVYVLREIARALAEAQDPTRARATLEEARRVAIGTKDPLALLSAAEGYADAGDSRTALELLGGLGNSTDERGYALNAVAKALAEAGSLQAAFQTAEMIKEPVYRADVMLKIAEVRLDNGEAAEARKTLQDAFRAAGPVQLSGSHNNEGSVFCRKMGFYLDLGKLQVRSGDLEGVYDTAVAAWRDYRTAGLPYLVLKQAAVARVRAGDVHGALAWAERQPDNVLRALGLLTIAEALLEGSEQKEESRTGPTPSWQ